MLTVLLIALCSTVVLVDVISLFLWKSPEYQPLPDQTLPFVSILVPIRNEASNIIGLVKCLKSLQYPPEKLEVLIGEDGSTDGTRELLDETIGSDLRFKVYPIKEGTSGLVAKANVIDKLIAKSRSNWFYITDADVRVPKTWIQSLQVGGEHPGVVGGTTLVRVRNLWSGLQNIDWLIAQGQLFVAGKLFKTLAVSGTNMMVAKEVTDSIGGYHKIPYSLTEDIGILTAAKKKGFSGKNVMLKEAMAEIEAQPCWRSLLSQRTRWIYGAVRLPFSFVLLLIIRTLFLLFVVLLAWWAPALALGFYLSKIFINWTFAYRLARHFGRHLPFTHIVLFEIFSFIISVGGLLRYLFSPTITWKGRKY